MISLFYTHTYRDILRSTYRMCRESDPASRSTRSQDGEPSAETY